MRDERTSDSGVAFVIVALAIGVAVFVIGAVGFWMMSRQQQLVVQANQMRMEAEQAHVIAMERQYALEQARKSNAESDQGTAAEADAEIDTDTFDADANGVAAEPVSLQVKSDGAIWFGETQWELDQLEAWFRANSDALVVLKVDNECQFQHVAKILAACEEAGLDNPRFELLPQ